MNELIEKIVISKKIEGDETTLMFVDFFFYDGD